MDFDKCEDGRFDDDHEQYQSQINQLSFIDNRTQHNGQDYIFVNNAQIHTYLIHNGEPVQGQNMLKYSHKSENRTQTESESENKDNSSPEGGETTTSQDNDTDEDDGPLLYDTQL